MNRGNWRVALLALAALATFAARPAQGQRTDSTLIVRVLDVGQGDAILIENGGSVVLVDGGPNARVLGRNLDAYGINGDMVDAVILTHAHGDHYLGRGELFASWRRITLRHASLMVDTRNATAKTVRTVARIVSLSGSSDRSGAPRA